MENTALNDTTTKDQDWKQKKGYVPLIVLTAVLLGLAFCAGQSRGTSLAVGSSTTRGGTTATASLMMYHRDRFPDDGADLQWPPVDMEPPKPFCVLIKDKADCLNATDDDGTQCYWTQRFGINHCLKKTEKHSFRGGTTATASLTMMSNDADSMEPPKSYCPTIKDRANCLKATDYDNTPCRCFVFGTGDWCGCIPDTEAAPVAPSPASCNPANDCACAPADGWCRSIASLWTLACPQEYRFGLWARTCDCSDPKLGGPIYKNC